VITSAFAIGEVPLIHDFTGSVQAPMLFVAAVVFVGGVATFFVLAYLARARDAHSLLPGVSSIGAA
jgi:hypothetical protein